MLNQGWQCPVCWSVYAPFVVKCENCPGRQSLSGGTTFVFCRRCNCVPCVCPREPTTGGKP